MSQQEALRYVYRFIYRIVPLLSTYNRPPLRTPPGAARGRYYDVVGILPMCETHRQIGIWQQLWLGVGCEIYSRGSFENLAGDYSKAQQRILKICGKDCKTLAFLYNVV